MHNVTGQAAEQRTIVAHSASYGCRHSHILKAPAGAKENRGSKSHFSRPIRGLNDFDHHSHGCHRGLLPHAAPQLHFVRINFELNTKPQL
jgi:hypothetical protein